VVEGVVTARVSHALLRRGFFDTGVQAAFLPWHSSEMQVWTMLETLRLRRAEDKQTFVLFVDIAKAYDSVHQAAALEVLRHIGVPESWLTLLAHWNSQRTCSVRVNDERCPPFPMTRGTPQGGVFSCLLFIIYFESLQRRIAADPRLQGVRIERRPRGAQPAGSNATSFTLKNVTFADDVSVATGSREQLQLALDVIVEWGEAWGLKLGFGAGKTEAMVIRRRGEPEQTPAPLQAGGNLVHFVQQYLHLGYLLRSDLSNAGMLDRIKDNMRRLFSRYFEYSRIVRSMPPVDQMQIAISNLTGAATYLLGVVPFSPTQLHTLDAVRREATRTIFMQPHGTPNTLLDAISKLPSAECIAATHRQRLLHHLRLTPYQCGKAAELYRFLQDEPPVPRYDPTARNWVAVTETLMAQHAAIGVYAPDKEDITRRWHVGRAARVYSRALAHRRWTQDLRMGTNAHARTAHIGVRPTRGAVPRMAVAEVYFLGQLDAAQLGHAAYATPASMLGPGCSGALETLCRLPPHRVAAVLALRTGGRALKAWPFRVWRRRGPTETERDAAESDPAYEDEGRAFVPQPCPHCPEQQTDIYHLALECPHPRLAAVREDTQAQLKDKLLHILDALRTAHEQTSSLDPAATAAAVTLIDTACALVRQLQATSAEGRAITWRVLLGAPFPAAMCPPSMHCAAAIGAALDATTLAPQHMRAYSGRWIRWASDRAIALAEAWRAAAPVVQAAQPAA
jgi:hypothetical protein